MVHFRNTMKKCQTYSLIQSHRQCINHPYRIFAHKIFLFFHHWPTTSLFSQHQSEATHKIPKKWAFWEQKVYRAFTRPFSFPSKCKRRKSGLATREATGDYAFSISARFFARGAYTESDNAPACAKRAVWPREITPKSGPVGPFWQQKWSGGLILTHFSANIGPARFWCGRSLSLQMQNGAFRFHVMWGLAQTIFRLIYQEVSHSDIEKHGIYWKWWYFDTPQTSQPRLF